jgi:hypothetical protein
MTFMALPWQMGVTKYAILLLVILGAVPILVSWLERDKPLAGLTREDARSCAVPPVTVECTEPLTQVAKQLGRDLAKHIWMLVKPTVTIMLLASLASSALLTLVPWPELLSSVTAARLALLSLVSVFMPVPIALDVMFAGQLYQQGVPSGYVMLFAITLGTYSIIPSIYLWREVSRKLAAALFVFFMAIGFGAGLAF